MRRVAEEEQVALIDVNRMYTDYGSGTGSSTRDLLLDGMHPNSAAHAKIAEEIERLSKTLRPAKKEGE